MSQHNQVNPTDEPTQLDPKIKKIAKWTGIALAATAVLYGINKVLSSTQEDESDKE